MGAPPAPFNVVDEELHLSDLLDLIARDSVGEIPHARVADIGPPRIVDGGRMVGDHRLHQADIADHCLMAGSTTPQTTVPTRTAIFAAMGRHIFHMNANITAVIRERG